MTCTACSARHAAISRLILVQHPSTVKALLASKAGLERSLVDLEGIKVQLEEVAKLMAAQVPVPAPVPVAVIPPEV